MNATQSWQHRNMGNKHMQPPSSGIDERFRGMNAVYTVGILNTHIGS